MAYRGAAAAPARRRSPATCGRPARCLPAAPARSRRTGRPGCARLRGAALVPAAAGLPRRRAGRAGCCPAGAALAGVALGRESVQRRPQPGGRVLRDLLEQRLPGDLRDCPGVERLDDGGVARCPHDDVARQQQADRAIGGQRPVASGGLQAPRMTYCSISSPSLSRSVACTSTSVSTPKPCAFSASRTRATAWSNGAGVRTVMP